MAFIGFAPGGLNGLRGIDDQVEEDLIDLVDMARDMRKAKANTEKVRKVIALWGGIALWPRRLTRGGFF